ncbi:transcriptional protein SWT1 isoform X2 [Copidosoma floridanum]|uniref:transcriptional protein SWT1 isoform X2 n=1 Tax=Copidosoma floridanum TaxID=29053 RepID=UPI0006C98EE9|nr:transcriptional protein SWT1 isoform X2 [Copidosoma floridanum]
MSNVLNALGKSKKVALTPGWGEAISRKHPDRPFYFKADEQGGSSEWAPPIESEDKSARKSKKRKIQDRDSEEFSDASPGVAGDILKNIIEKRPKLKVKNVSVLTSSTPNNDTPAMRLYREKLALRKAEAESKKSGSKSVGQKKKDTPTVSEKTTENSEPLTPSRRTRRSSSVASSSTSASDCSAVSSTTSIGTKITKAATSACRVDSPKSGSNTVKADKTVGRIPKVIVSRVEESKTNHSNNNSKSANDKGSDNDVSPNTSIKITRKNLANERLAKLRKSLTTPNNKSPGASRVNSSSDDVDNSSSRKNQIEANCGLILTNVEQQRNEEYDLSNQRILEKISSSTSVYCEEMEWEAVGDEKIMSEVYSARVRLCEEPSETLSELSCNVLQAPNIPGETNAFYIVIDTNVYLSNLTLIEEVRDFNSNIFGRPFIVVPWTVLQELDFIKDDKNNTRSEALKYKARKAVDFLNRYFTAKHPRFLGQTPRDVKENKKKFATDCPDDEILQTCLQIKESAKTPVLLSYDKNLCTKAMIHDITILGRNDPLEKMYFLKAAETTHFLSNSLHGQIEEPQGDSSILQQELLKADDIIEEGKAILKTVLSQVVAKEMKNLFGDRWEKHAIIHPPWSVHSVLKCALKHWMAAVSESFYTRKTEKVLQDLQIYLKNLSEDGRKLKEVKTFLYKSKEVIQTLQITKYATFKENMLLKINNLMQKCLESMDEVKGVRFLDSVGLPDESEEEQKATLAFKVLEDVYAFARDTCGIAADILGLQCAFAYNKFNPLLTPKLALREHQNVGISVNKLLQILRVSLSTNYENICPDDKIILSLHEVLVNFSTILNDFDELSKLTPLDLFCCIKLNKSKLEKGYEQLQELAIHFCRMANFQCNNSVS